MAIMLKTASVRVSSIQIMQVRVQNKGKSVWKYRYSGDVSICFIVLADLIEFSGEVLCGWSVGWSRRSRYEEKDENQELKLGDAQVTPSKYSRRLKRLSLGMPRKASPLSWTSIFWIRFVYAICANLRASFAFSFHFSFMHHAGMR